MAELLVDRRGAVAVLTLHRPERLNAVNEPLYEHLLAALAELAADRTARAIVLAGAGRAFCVGADLVGHQHASRDDSQRRHYAELGQRAARALLTHRLPVVAAVHGHAIGAGLELALACDLVVAGDDAKLRFPEFGLGTFVGGGVLRTLVTRVGATKARELLLLGRFFSGRDAAAFGLANQAAPGVEVPGLALALADELATKAPRSLALAKQLLAAPPTDLDALLAAECDALLECMTTSDWREGLAAFAERRNPNFTGD